MNLMKHQDETKTAKGIRERERIKAALDQYRNLRYDDYLTQLDPGVEGKLSKKEHDSLVADQIEAMVQNVR